MDSAVNARSKATRLFAWVVAAFFILSAAYFLLTTLCAIGNFAWRQPMFDQWRMYDDFLDLPFPQNVLQQVNGHRPIIPNLIRVAEIHWFTANQLLQIGFGTACLFASWCVLIILVWRQENSSIATRAAQTMLVTLGLFWFANARMLAHGNESLHVYVLVLAMVAAAVCTYQSSKRQSSAYLVAASLCCIIATFCFGSGIASFPAVIALTVLLGLPWRWLFIPLAALALCLSLYFVLPGNEGVRGMLSLHAVDGFLTIARWLSSPWINGWLGFADPPIYSWMNTTPPHPAIAHVLRTTANLVTAITGFGWRDLGAWIGAAGILGWTILVIRMLVSQQRPDRLQAVMLGIGLFGMATACVIGLGRLGYMTQNPEQVYADRYLVWPSLFWMSTAVLLTRASQRSDSAIVRRFAFVAWALLPIALLPTHASNLIWTALVYRNSQANAAALESGVYDEAHFPGQGTAPMETLHHVDLMRSKRVAMFADGAWQHVGEHWTGTLQSPSGVAAQAHWLAPVHDPVASKPAGHLEGWATSGVRRLQKRGRIAILTGDGVIAGLAEWSFPGPNIRFPLLRLPRKRGFDGYVHDFDSNTKYTIAWLDFDTGAGVALGEVGDAAR